MRYYIKLRGSNQYLCPPGEFHCPQWWHDRRTAREFGSAAEARAWRDECAKKWHTFEYEDGVVVRLLSAEESRERARRRGILDALAWLKKLDGDTGETWASGWVGDMADGLKNGSISFDEVKP